MAYAAVVLIGLLVVVQTLSPDVSALHRVPRTLSGQAEFTVIPPAPAEGVSGVSKIPSDAPDADRGRAQEGSAEPDEQTDEQTDERPGEAPTAPPAEEPDAPSSGEPADPADPGEGEGDPTPPTLVPSVGPIPGIMAPLLWPFVAEEDARPVDEAVPMFLRQLIAADAGIPVEDLPLGRPKADREPEATEETKKPAKDPGASKSEAARIAEDACELTAAIAEDVKTLPGASEAPKPEATPECGKACTEPKTPVGSSPAADPEAPTPSAEPSEHATETPEREQEPKDGGKDDTTCAEKSVQ
jgi:hypothetical protein